MHVSNLTGFLYFLILLFSLHAVKFEGKKIKLYCFLVKLKDKICWVLWCIWIETMRSMLTGICYGQYFEKRWLQWWLCVLNVNISPRTCGQIDGRCFWAWDYMWRGWHLFIYCLIIHILNIFCNFRTLKLVLNCNIAYRKEIIGI